uniref:Amino acid permease n=1 Tax=Oryza meridionalis TaxID=40149 RepID=A0A0E0C4H5_9ORYZ
MRSQRFISRGWSPLTSSRKRGIGNPMWWGPQHGPTSPEREKEGIDSETGMAEEGQRGGYSRLAGDEEVATASGGGGGGGGGDYDERKLRLLGYEPQLKRNLSLLSNFAVSFSIVSVLTGITTLFGTGLQFGGPATMVYGWPIAGAMTLVVGLAMAEICSAYPTSGGLYFWSARLCSHRRWGPFASWLTGWFNIVGQWAVTTSVDFSLAQLIQVIILLSTGGNNGGGYMASKYVVIAFHAAILLSHAAINSLPITWLSFFGQFAAAWNMLGVFVLMIAVPTVATERASAKFVFTHFNTENNAGIHSNFYIFVLGLLMSQYTLTGYDASAHMTEETKNADRNGPIGIISAIGISIIVGWGYILGITFAVKDIPYLLSPDNDAGGYAIAEVFYLAFKSRYGSGIGGIICLGIVAVAIYFCGMSSVTSNSRMAYAFSRDGAMPLSSVWHKVNKHEVPINAVWLSALISLCMALPSLGSLVAFQAMVSIATIGLYVAYALPILFRVTLARKHFVPGPFNLGRCGVAVGWAAVLWVATITVLFSLPVSYPVTKDTLNYTPVAVGGLFLLVLSSWLLSARHWFKGPITNLDG